MVSKTKPNVCTYMNGVFTLGYKTEDDYLSAVCSWNSDMEAYVVKFTPHPTNQANVVWLFQQTLLELLSKELFLDKEVCFVFGSDIHHQLELNTFYSDFINDKALEFIGDESTSHNVKLIFKVVKNVFV